MRRRIWSEHVPFQKLARDSVLDLLASRSIQLIVAVQPSTLSALPRLVEACGDAGVELGIWPLLEDEHGRWPSGANVLRFRDHLLRVLETIEPLPHTVTELVFDLEPPLSLARQLLSLRIAEIGMRPRGSGFEVTKRRFEELVREVRAFGLQPTAVVLPMILCEPNRDASRWQRLMGTPVDGVSFDQVIVMAYSSLIEGYTRRALPRDHARSLLALICERTRERWGEKAAVALGIVGGGALGDERPYRGVVELVEDVAVARAAGIEDLALFGMAGVLSRRPHPGRWLDALVDTPPSRLPTETTLRARLSWDSAVVAGQLYHSGYRALGAFSRLRNPRNRGR